MTLRDSIRNLFGSKADHEAAGTATLEPSEVIFKTVSQELSKLIADRVVASMLGGRRASGKSVFLAFDTEAAAAAAHAAALARGAQPAGPPQGLRFSDGKAALEYPFSERCSDPKILEFCRCYEGTGVQAVMADGCSVETQRQILAVFGMKEGLSFK